MISANPNEKMHASAPDLQRCADCSMDGEACPRCYQAWWQRRHPNIKQLPAESPCDHGVTTVCWRCVNAEKVKAYQAQVQALHERCAHLLKLASAYRQAYGRLAWDHEPTVDWTAADAAVKEKPHTCSSCGQQFTPEEWMQHKACPGPSKQ